MGLGRRLRSIRQLGLLGLVLAVGRRCLSPLAPWTTVTLTLAATFSWLTRLTRLTLIT